MGRTSASRSGRPGTEKDERDEKQQNQQQTQTNGRTKEEHGKTHRAIDNKGEDEGRRWKTKGRQREDTQTRGAVGPTKKRRNMDEPGEFRQKLNI